MALPIIFTSDPANNRMQSQWKSQLDPVLANVLGAGRLIKGVSVVTGLNTINHGLGRPLQGYIVVLNSANVTFYDNQLTNQQSSLTLLLVASGSATISLWVF